MPTYFFALLAIGSFLAVFSVTAASVASASARRVIVETVGPVALWCAAVVAIVTTGGSLYLSEVLNYVPCRLCWYQRAMAYPLALILPSAIMFRRPLLQRAAFPLAAIGALISCYHLLIERYPGLESSTCDPNNPCSLVWVRHFGIITIPMMALASFLLHLMLAIVAEQARKEHP